MHRLPFTIACPFTDDVGIHDEEALIIRRAMRRERVFRDRGDPFALPDNEIHERYKFSREGMLFLCALLLPHIEHRKEGTRALSPLQMVCYGLCFLAPGLCLYSVGDAERLSKATVMVHIFVTFLGHRQETYIKEDLYRIAINLDNCYFMSFHPGFPNVLGVIDCTQIRLNRSAGEHEGDYVTVTESNLFKMICEANIVITNIEANAIYEVTNAFTLFADSHCQCLHHLRVTPERACDIVSLCGAAQHSQLQKRAGPSGCP
uniref:Nuclease HARBI1 n=1 Tax=Gouania willdenowi TaxID=441366 RepID=A0A8C5DIM1_GOUWI